MGRVIIDGDTYIYKAACACSSLINIDKDLYYEGYDLNKARAYLKETITNLCERCRVDDYVLVIEAVGSTNYRKMLNENYKSNRKKVKRPVMLNIVRDMVKKEFTTASIPCLEADDVVRIMYERGEGNIIVSIDKDLKTFPSTIYDSYHDTFTYVLPQQAEANFKRQLLIGDATDGYSGIKGIGQATANKLLIDGITEDDIIQMYIDKGMDIEAFKSTYNSAKILSNNDYNDGIIKLYGGEVLDIRDKQKEYLGMATTY